PVDRLQADLTTQQSQQKGANYSLKNDPPRIIFSNRPATLVLIDGQPVLRALPETGLQRVVNTRALMLFDQNSNTYYLYLLNGWAQAPSPEGPWSAADRPPRTLDKAKNYLVASHQVDLNNNDTGRTDFGHRRGRAIRASGKMESLRQRVKDGTFPTIYVSTVPAELLICQGQPQFQQLQGTGLLYVTNTGDRILLDTSTQDIYILISGRWFRSKSLEGPWQYIAGKDLPSDFAKIPEGHAEASVLASTPGTPAAQEALIANNIPQTACIKRAETHLTVSYDGEPQFKPIEGTTLEYAVNSEIPVIEVASNNYCAVQNGVWFTADAPV